MRKHTCFWCRKYVSKITIDHLVPVCVGGGDENSNLVKSCEACNQDRGTVTSNYGNLKAIQKRAEKWDVITTASKHKLNRAIRRMRKRLPQMLANQARLVELEFIRLGYSPLSKIVLECPEIRPIPVEVKPNYDHIRPLRHAVPTPQDCVPTLEA